MERSPEDISDDHLRRLSQIAERELNSLYERRPDFSGKFRNSLFAICLCQGAALHREQLRLDPKNAVGVKDLDIWAFYKPLPGYKFPPRTRLVADFGASSLGQDESLGKGWQGRKVDIMGRDIECRENDTPRVSIRRFLSTKPTDSAWYLSEKPVIAVWPAAELGAVYWSLEDSNWKSV